MKCLLRVADTCRHPAKAGPTDDARCASCTVYMGPARGLGDIVARMANATGIAGVVQAVNPNCRCGPRLAAMNQAVPFADTTAKDSTNGPNV